MLLLKCSVFDSKKLKLLKEQEATIIHKTFETKSDFHVKWRTTGKF